MVVAFAATGAAWLATATTSTISITVPSGLTNNSGKTISLTAMSTSITRPNGNASLQSGLALERVDIVSGYGTGISFDSQWLDPQDAGKVLNNPNAQITIGFYYPVHTGTCSSSEVSITDTVSFCAALDTAATGYPVDNGDLILSQVQLGGRFQTAVSDSSATTTCSSSGSTWCLPSGIGNPSGTEVGYLVASIQVPGGKPKGQQGQLSSLQFYFSTSRH